MSKHSPGPWEVVTVKKAPSPLFTICAGSQPVCDMYRGVDKSDGLIEADAALIAAAPELLEALESIENDDGHIPAPIWEKVCAALDKAKGGRP